MDIDRNFSILTTNRKLDKVVDFLNLRIYTLFNNMNINNNNILKAGSDFLIGSFTLICIANAPNINKIIEHTT